MIGIMMLLVAGTYIAIWILVVRFSYRLTFRVTESKKKSFSIAAAFFLIMYLVPLWDFIPTLVMHKHYCEAEAGLTVYKTLEEWVEENPGVLKNLEPYQDHVPLTLPIGKGTKMNDRFGSIYQEVVVSSLPIKKQRIMIVDIEKNSIISENIDFSRGFGQFNLGHPGWWKFWLLKNHCFSYDERISSVRTMKFLFNKFKMTRS